MSNFILEQFVVNCKIEVDLNVYSQRGRESYMITQSTGLW